MDGHKHHSEPRRIESETEKALHKTRRSVLKGAAAVGVGSVAASGVGAAASPTWTVKSPSDKLKAEVTQGSNGQLHLTISYEGSQVLEPSSLGIETSIGDFVTGLSFQSRTDQQVNDQYQTIDGPSEQHHHQAKQATFTFTSEAGRRIELDVRVADEGVTYRYRIPGSGPIRVTNEENAFQVPTESDAWLMPYHDGYENVWRKTTATAASGEYGFPTLFEVGSDEWLLLTEADVDRRYCASRLTAKDESTFEITFPEEAVEWTLPLETPWRVAMVGDLETVVESDLVTDVSPSSNLEDDSWVNPGRVAWSWWSVGTGDLETQKDFTDYAAKHDWEYVLVDAGWDAEWVPDLVDYANNHGVEVLLWSAWSDLNEKAEREDKLSRWKSWGIAGIKVDYMNSDEQSMMDFYDDLLEATADHELMLNFHGSTVPKGRRRRWPHLMTSEAIHGAEQYFSEIPPTHNVILPFTRNVVGPMDYTPVTFSAGNRATTAGHELALSVVYESAWQHFADNVDVYADWPLAERFLDRVSTAWDETQFVGGRPGSEATIARRKGKEWFIGSIIAGDARTVDVSLSFLKSRRPYIAEITRDDDDGGLVLERSIIRRGDTISVDVPENGGSSVRLFPRKGGSRISPATDLSVLQDGADIDGYADYRFPQSGDILTTKFTNLDPDMAVNEVEIDFGADSDWTINSTSSTTFRSVQPGESVETTWEATPPAETQTKADIELNATTTYSYRGRGPKRSETTRTRTTLTVPKYVPASADATYLSDLDWVDASNGWGPVERDMSNGETGDGDGTQLSIGNTVYEKGLGCHARSEIKYDLSELSSDHSTYSASIGIDEEVGDSGSVVFRVLTDGTTAFESDELTGSMDPRNLEVDVTDVGTLSLIVDPVGGNGNDHADWGDAKLS